MQLHDVFDAPQLRIRAVHTTDSALSQLVNWTFTTDLIDPRRYLTRGQLVMTGLVWRREAEDSETFVKAVAESGAIALFAGEGLFGYIPADVVEACVRHDLSLFAVPAEVSFASITAHISNTLASDRVARLTSSLVRQRELLSDVYRGQLLDDLITRTSTELGRPIWVLSSTGRQLVEPLVPLTLGDVDAVVSSALAAREVPVTVIDTRGQELSVFPVIATGEHPATAWFLVVSGDWNEWHPSVLDTVTELGAVTGLYRVQRSGETYGWSTTSDRLVELIDADSDQPETAAYLRQAGLDEAARLIVVAASFVGESGTEALAGALLADAAAHLGRPVVGTDREGRVIAIIPADIPDTVRPGTDALALVSTALRRLAPGLGDSILRIGTSNPASIAELGGALRSARYGLLLPPATGERGTAVQISGSESVTSSVQLLAAVPDHLRRVFAELVLGRLLEHDARYNSSLAATLTAFLDCGGSWVRTAERTHLHLNTVRYRIARVEELTGRDLGNTADRADLYLALQLL